MIFGAARNPVGPAQTAHWASSQDSGGSVTSVVHGRRWPVLLAVAAGCAVGAASASAAGMAPSGTLTAKPAKTIHIRTAKNIAAPKAPKGVAINRPTMSMKAYHAAKAAAASHRAMA